MQYINLTPHPIVVRLSRNNRIVIPETKQVARVKFATTYLDTINGIPIHERMVTAINALPKPRKDVLYIVSAMLQENAEDRTDLLSPDRYNAFVERGRMIETDRLVRFRKD